MFFVTVVLILVSIHLYLWKRLVKDTTTRRSRARRALTAALAGLFGLAVAALVVPRRVEIVGVSEARWIAWPGYLWFGLAVYLFLALLALEPVRPVLGRWIKRRSTATDSVPADPPAEAVSKVVSKEEAPALDRRLFLARSCGVAAGVASGALVGVGTVTAVSKPDLLRVPVRLRRLDRAFDGFRIAVVSDVHLGALAGRARMERLVRMINEADPDLVAIVGDLVDGSVDELGRAVEPLQDLVSREGAFFVTGNHEYFVGDTLSWLRELERLGIAPLRNNNTQIRRRGATFGLAGVNDIAGARHEDPPDFDRALAGLDHSGPTVLLAHQPVAVMKAAARGVDLQISGHTHGGQMWPFHYAVRLAQPSLAGLSTVDETQLYVTRGAGFWGPPVRVGAPPDITILSLHAAG